MPVEVRLLGKLEILGVSGARSEIYRPKRIAALSYLLLENRPVQRLELASILWPDADTKRARGSLNEMLLQLRRIFGPESIIARADDHLVLDHEMFSCDAVELGRAAAEGRHRDAVRLFTGDLLPSFTVPDGSAFDDWVEAARARLRLTVADSAWQLAATVVDERESLSLLELCARLNPFDEAVLRRRLEATLSLKGTAAALALYESTRQLFLQQLGTSLSPETKALVNAMCAAPAGPEPTFTPHSDGPGLNAELALLHEPKSHPSRRRWSWMEMVAGCALVLVLGFVGFKMFPPVLAAGSPAEIVILPPKGAAESWNEYVVARMAATLRHQRTVVMGSTRGSAGTHVQTTFRIEGEVVVGIVEITGPDGEITASLPLTMPRRLGLDSVAAVAARFILATTQPIRNGREQKLAAARAGIERAFGDFSRGALPDAFTELARADSALSSVARIHRDDEWTQLEASRLYTPGLALRRRGQDSIAGWYLAHAARVARTADTDAGTAAAIGYRAYQKVFDTGNKALADSFSVELAEAVRRYPRNAVLWKHVSAARLDNADFAGAISAVEKARQLDPMLLRDLELSLNKFQAAWNGRFEDGAVAECDRIRHMLRNDWPADFCSILSNGWANGTYDLTHLARRFESLPGVASPGNIEDRLRLLYGASLALRGDTALAAKAVAATPRYTKDADLAVGQLVALRSLGRHEEANGWHSHILLLPAGRQALLTMSRAAVVPLNQGGVGQINLPFTQ